MNDDIVDVLDDGLIDESGFELGLPSLEDMLRHECDLLRAELDTTQRDLRQAHKNVAKLIVMYRGSVAELSALRVEHRRISRCLSERYEADRENIPTIGYAYGDYSNSGSKDT
jgi:hypothetical protein